MSPDHSSTLPVRRVPPARPQASRGGFSLVEMVVVGAVIVALASVLVPTAARIQSGALTQKTVSNLRTLQLANIAYASDNDGRYVAPQVNGDWAGGMWFQNEDFLSRIGACKTDRMWDEDWPEVAKSGLRSANPKQPPGKMDRQASIGINLGLREHWANSDGSFNDLSFHRSRIKYPSQAMAFADATDMWIRMDRADNWVSDAKAAQNGWYDMSIAYRNNGKAAVVFFDGHVELLTRQQCVGNYRLWIPDAE